MRGKLRKYYYEIGKEFVDLKKDLKGEREAWRMAKSQFGRESYR